MKYLIVDDHALVTSALSLMLMDREPDAQVHTAGNVQNALTLIDREGETADLLILDLTMPGVTGTELMEEIGRSSTAKAKRPTFSFWTSPCLA